MLLNLYVDIGLFGGADANRLKVLVNRAHIFGETVELHLCVHLLIFEINENILNVLHFHLFLKHVYLAWSSEPG